MDGGAWWAAVYGVAQSRTRLKRLSSSGSIGEETGAQHRELGLSLEITPLVRSPYSVLVI